MSDLPIGLIGAGLLGSALAERMLAAGRKVLAYDVERSHLERLERAGGATAASSAEVAGLCDVIVLCLPDSRVVQVVVAELENHLQPRALLIDATTGDPDDAAKLAKQLAARGIGYIDATIAGSSEQARRGEATVIIGGSEDDVRRAELVLAAWSDKRFHVGSTGSGARLKLVVNLVLGLNRAALAEGLALAKACGIELAGALKVLQATPAYSPIMDTKGPKMIARDYSPQARLAQHLKDVRLIREMARRHGARTPLSDVHEELLQRAVELGYGEADNSAVIEALGE